MPKNIMGTAPSSRSVPMFEVCFCTPSKALQNVMCILSIGLFFGSFKQAQKSELYKRIGFTSESNKEIVVRG